MNITLKITDPVIRDTMTRAIQDVFRTMLQKTATQVSMLPGDENGEPIKASVNLQGSYVVGTVGFVGDLKGLLTLYIDSDYADIVTGQMLGMSTAEVAEAGHEVSNDTIGELTNMAAGAFKNQLADKGYPCKLTIPSLMRGHDLLIEPAATASRRVYKYSVDDRFVYADLSIKHSDGSGNPFPN